MDNPQLRKRIATAREALGLSHNNAKRDLRAEDLFKLQDKLLPLFPESYFQQVEKLRIAQGKDAIHKLPKSAMALKHALHVPIVTVTNLTVQPGEPHFVLWLFISSYFPLVSACMAPVGNLISLIGLIQHWRVDKATGKTINDSNGMMLLNTLAFLFGLLGNFSLMMNFSGKMKYLVTQSVSIFCWIIAATFLLVAVLITNADFVGHDTKYRRSEGFWLAVFTIGMYYSCSIVLLINFAGYKLGKYPPTFNLDKKQRLLMMYTIAFVVWQTVGTVVMTHLIEELTYGASLYYCTVSMLTIGLGDIVPKTPGAKVFALTFSLIGVIIMGLVVAMIRQVVLSSAGPSIFWHQIEMARVKELEKIEREHLKMTYEESFHKMRMIRKVAKFHQINMSLLFTLLTFVAFWLFGGLVFHFSENWDYFNSIYFCFLCLVTIGYGDFAPKSSFGRVFFVLWAITAVPLMTILISNAGDELFNFADRFDHVVTLLFKFKTYRFGKNAPYPPTTAEQDVADEERSENEEIEGVVRETKAETDSSEAAPTLLDENLSAMHKALQNHHIASSGILNNVDILRTLMFDSIDSPTKRYDLDEWSGMLEKLRLRNESEEEADPLFWLELKSPLRLPIREPNYLLLKMFFRIERDLKQLINLQQRDLAMINGTEHFRPASPFDPDTAFERVVLASSLRYP